MKKKLIGFALIAGAVAVAAKLMAAQKAEWQGLSEAEVRERMEQRMPARVPEEKRADVADKVVAKMRERGMLREEPAEAAAEVESELDQVAEQDEAGEPAEAAETEEEPPEAAESEEEPPPGA